MNPTQEMQFLSIDFVDGIYFFAYFEGKENKKYSVLFGEFCATFLKKYLSLGSAPMLLIKLLYTILLLFLLFLNFF